MRAAQERSQERLPPKKRELPAAAAGEEQEEAAGGRAGPGRRGAGGGGGAAEWAPAGYGAEGAGGLPVEPYGLLYKVAAVPPVVSVSPLPPAFSVASPLLPPPGLPYSPVHYAQLPPAPLHFVGPPYSLPYALPPGFLPGPLLPAARLPHFVPYAPLLLEEAGPPAHGLGKNPAGPLALQPQGGSQLLDVGQSRFPVQYQLSHLPAGYSTAFELPLADQTMELPLQDPKLITANGMGRPAAAAAAAAAGTKLSEVLDVGSGSAEGHLPRTTAESPVDSRFFTSCQSLRTDVSMASQRSTPETDLEVQRVVGVFVSQDHPACSGQQEEDLSPLNLSHPRDLLEQGEEPGRNPGPAAAEKSHHPRLSAKSPEELLYHNQILRGLTMANGKAISGSLPPAAPDNLGRGSPGGLPDLDCTPSQGGHLPSHFMKGAIIQLATGELKRVEDLQTQDFVRSAEVSGGLKIDSSTVVDIQESPWQGFVTLHFVVGEQQSKVSIDVPPEHPFFVYGQGWSSCSPERTARLFALPCHRLQEVKLSIEGRSNAGK
ncbi:UNVERIFIED_CONTAM: hypothetical protein K2H54_047364 [Gekko kuhli]